MKEIIIVSNNKAKIKEAQEILNEFKIISIGEIGINIDIEEDQETFEDNAIKKAITVAKDLEGKLCVADDSGIEIEALGGFPGVYTKRWQLGTDRERNLAIIEKMKGIERENRKIKFISAIAISNGKETICKIGSLDGYVSETIRGKNGFGFDEIFELENGKTLAELEPEEKNKISARKIALNAIREELNRIGHGE